MAVAIEIERNAVERAYDRWAPVYDLVFGPVFERGRRASLIAAERIGGRILEVGVGTGISLPNYSRSNRIVGVDISEAMLSKARERVRESKLEHVEALDVMDAERDRVHPTKRNRPIASACACVRSTGLAAARSKSAAGIRDAAG